MNSVTPDRPGADDPGRGRRLGVDVGSVRIGIASCDPDGILATPVETVRRTPRTDEDLRRVAALAAEYEVVEIIVGLPQTLRAEHGTAAKAATDFADQLATLLDGVPIRFADERLTTVSAQRSLRESGVKAKGQRAMVDQVAAVGILQGWLDQRKSVLEQQRRSLIELERGIE